MTDSITVKSNAFAAYSQNEEQTNFEPPHSDANQNARVQNTAAPGHHLNLREALEWLLGTHAHHEEEKIPHDEKEARRNRRMDLLMWLLNLEPRLAPYGE